MSLGTQFLPKILPSGYIVRPSVIQSPCTLSLAVQIPYRSCIAGTQIFFFFFKLGVNGMAFEAVFFQQTFNFLLLIIPTTQLVRNSEVKVWVGRDERYLPLSVRHVENFSVPDFQKSL
jgi:hypothetical protein